MNSSVRRTFKVLAPLVAMLGLLAAPSAASALDVGTVRGWWPLNEGSGQTVNDRSSYRNHGTLGSTPGPDANDPTWIKGIFYGSGLHFGGDDFVTIPDSAALEPQHFTLSLWTRAPQSPGPFKYLLAKGSNQCVAAQYGIWTDGSGGIEFYVFNGGDLVRAWGGTPAQIWDGRWHNVTATWDGSVPRLYLDGKLLGEVAPRPTEIPYDAQPDGTTSFAGYRGSCDLMFTGDIDQVMMFDKVLPVDQIWQRWGFILNKPTYE